MSCCPNDREGPDCTLETPMRMGERVTARKLPQFALDINTAHKIRVGIPLSCFISVPKTLFQQGFRGNQAAPGTCAAFSTQLLQRCHRYQAVLKIHVRSPLLAWLPTAFTADWLRYSVRKRRLGQGSRVPTQFSL